MHNRSDRSQEDVIMRPAEVEKIYIERLRQMEGEQRMKIASDLFEAVKEIAKVGILSQNPEMDEDAIRQELKKRLYK